MNIFSDRLAYIFQINLIWLWLSTKNKLCSLLFPLSRRRRPLGASIRQNGSHVWNWTRLRIQTPNLPPPKGRPRTT